MHTVTMSSEQAHHNWQDTVDTAHTGSHILIEQDDKPIVVLINYEEYQELKRRAELSDPPSVIKARNDANKSWVSQEEIDEIFAHVRHPV